jgi:hypothetical protein
MTVFEEEKPEDGGTWFPYFSSRFDVGSKKFVYDEPLTGAARFCVRASLPFYLERQKLRKHRHEFVLNTSSRSMERVSYLEDQTPEEIDKERADLQDYVVTGIEGAKWSDGREIECTRDNKLKLFKNEEFDRFVGKCLLMLSSLAEASEKN